MANRANGVSFGVWGWLRSRKQLRDGFGFHQLAGLVEVVVDDGFGVDAEGVVNRREQFRGVHGVALGAEAVLSDSPWT